MSSNTNNILTKTLLEFGLSEKEAAVYLALLQLETASVHDLAKYAGVNRSSTYVVLESLRKKGVAGISETNKGPKYVPAPPDVLYKIAEDSAKKTQETKDRIKKILPSLRAIHKDSKIKPSVQVFEGKEGIMNLYNDALSSQRGSIMRAFSQPGAWSKFGPEYFAYLREKRKERGVHLRAIRPNIFKNDEEFGNEKSKKRLAEFRFLQKDTKPLTSDFRIYDDKIALTSSKDEFGIIIENKEIVDAVKFIFDLAWDKAEKAPSKNPIKKLKT